MKREPVNQARKERTLRELRRLSDTIADWLAHRRSADCDETGQYIGRHKTQLEALESVLLGAADQLRAALNAVATDQDTGAVYDQCRDYDQAIVWLQRLWEFFKAKFDQRDDTARLGPLLKSADEVVWSCYRQAFVRAENREPGLKQGPAPLAFIEPEYSPAALESDKPLPSSLGLGADIDFLDDYLKSLPIPIIRLPPWCVEAPWWLVYVGHEVGHHVQHDLGLVGYFREGLEAVAQAGGAPAADVKRWGVWAEEIFADVFSVVAMGPWAVWAVAEAEWSAPDRMAQRKAKYPAPVVRLALMARAADALGVDGKSALRGLPLKAIAAHNPHAEADLARVDDMVQFALGPMRGNLGALGKLCDFSAAAFGDGGEVQRWAGALYAQGATPALDRLHTARHLVSGALRMWAQIVEMEDAPARDAARLALAAKVRETLPRSGPPGTRAAYMPGGKLPERGAALGELLLKASRERRA